MLFCGRSSDEVPLLLHVSGVSCSAAISGNYFLEFRRPHFVGRTRSFVFNDNLYNFIDETFRFDAHFFFHDRLNWKPKYIFVGLIKIKSNKMIEKASWKQNMSELFGKERTQFSLSVTFSRQLITINFDLSKIKEASNTENYIKANLSQSASDSQDFSKELCKVCREFSSKSPEQINGYPEFSTLIISLCKEKANHFDGNLLGFHISRLCREAKDKKLEDHLYMVIANLHIYTSIVSMLSESEKIYILNSMSEAFDSVAERLVVENRGPLGKNDIDIPAINTLCSRLTAVGTGKLCAAVISHLLFVLATSFNGQRSKELCSFFFINDKKLLKLLAKMEPNHTAQGISPFLSDTFEDLMIER